MHNAGGVFVISVAARLVAMHPNTLRKYERQGFLEPARTNGNLRRYSRADIARLRQIKHLVEDRGINLAGVELALDLTERIRCLRDDVRTYENHLDKKNSNEDHSMLRRRLDDQVRALLEILGAERA